METKSASQLLWPLIKDAHHSHMEAANHQCFAASFLRQRILLHVLFTSRIRMFPPTARTQRSDLRDHGHICSQESMGVSEKRKQLAKRPTLARGPFQESKCQRSATLILHYLGWIKPYESTTYRSLTAVVPRRGRQPRGVLRYDEF